MKKIFALLTLVFGISYLNAQITITVADLPQIGDTYFTSTDTTPTISLGAPSASFQSWNFSALTQDYPSFPTYGNTASTAFASVYPTSNIYTYGPAAMFSSLYGSTAVAGQGMSQGHMFWRTDNSGLWIEGFRADSGTFGGMNIHENPTELLIGTPATYGTSFNNSGKYILPMNQNVSNQDTFYVNRVSKTLTTDAWGSITTPGGTYPNVIRIHEYDWKVDSAYIKVGTVTVYSMEISRDTLNNYIFMANGVHYPVCIVHANKNNVVKSVEYYTLTIHNLGINEHALANDVVAYPNPFTTSCTILIPKSYSVNDASLQLFDITGKQVYACSLKSNLVDVKNENYTAGLYFYIIRNAEGKELKGKLLLEN